jgi:outer membrane lipoprotein-sorting protein
MEVCQEHAQYQTTPQGGHTMSIEYKMYKNAQCITKEEFEAQMKAQQGVPSPIPTPDNWDIK